jgi:hypothetical protein
MSVEKRPWGVLQTDDETGRVTPIVKDRRGFVLDEDFSLDTNSMVGSAFHVLVDRLMTWQGVVVAEPAAGRYLCYIDVLEENVEGVQRIFSLDTLMGLGEEARRMLEGAYGDGKAPIVDPFIEWRFYDSEARAKEAYAAWAVTRREEVDA